MSGGLEQNARCLTQTCPAGTDEHASTPLYAFDQAVLGQTDMALDVNSSSLSGFMSEHARLLMSQFALGPSLSGAQPHFHGNAVNALVFGIRLWLLFPPACAFFSNQTALEFFLAYA